MNDETLIRALHQITVVDDLRCLGCGYEHHCSTHGCAIIKQAAERLHALTALEPNEPLTLEELREIDRDWVWCVVGGGFPNGGYYCFCDHGLINTFAGNVFRCEAVPDWVFLRHRPKEGTP